MNIKSLDEITDSIEIKSRKILTKINDIKKLDNSKLDMNYKNLNILVSINENLNIINDKLDDLNIELLEIQDLDNLNFEQKDILREHKFQQIFKKTLLPYVIYLRLCLET